VRSISPLYDCKADQPQILYQFEPTAEWRVFKRSPPPPQKIDSKGRPMWERWSKPGTEVQPLLDYAILPDQVRIVGL